MQYYLCSNHWHSALRKVNNIQVLLCLGLKGKVARRRARRRVKQFSTWVLSTIRCIICDSSFSRVNLAILVRSILRNTMSAKNITIFDVTVRAQFFFLFQPFSFPILIYKIVLQGINLKKETKYY